MGKEQACFSRRRNKSVLIISAVDIWSMGNKKGAQTLWYTLKGFADSYWKVFFLTSGEIDNCYHNLHKNIEVKNFSTLFFKRWMSIKTIKFFIRPIWWLYFQLKMFALGSKIARSHDIDIFYGYEVIGTPVSKLLSLRFKKPFVSRFQGTILKPKMTSKLWKLRHWHHYIGMKLSSDLVIMTNDGTEGDKVLSQLNIDMQKVKFWMNGVNKNIYNPVFDKDDFKEKHGISKQTKIILSVSRLVYWKRVDRIIYAMREIGASFPDVKLLIIGDGPEKNNLEKLTTALSLNRYILFIGSVPHNEVFDYLNCADLFTSLYDLSNVGNPLLEAMMCGKCIITLNNGDTGRFIENEKNGILLDIENLNKLSAIACRILKEEEQRKLLGQKAREFAESHLWSWDERMNAEINAVERLLK